MFGMVEDTLNCLAAEALTAEIGDDTFFPEGRQNYHPNVDAHGGVAVSSSCTGSSSHTEHAIGGLLDKP